MAWEIDAGGTLGAARRAPGDLKLTEPYMAEKQRSAWSSAWEIGRERYIRDRILAYTHDLHDPRDRQPAVLQHLCVCTDRTRHDAPARGTWSYIQLGRNS